MSDSNMRILITFGLALALGFQSSANDSAFKITFENARKIDVFRFDGSEKLQNWTLWSDDESLHTDESRKTLNATLDQTRRLLLDAELSSLLENKSPTLAFLFSKTWKASGGYWSPEVRDPEGSPVLLFRSGLASDSLALQRIIIHELSHVRHAQLRTNEAVWVREWVALLAEARVFRGANLMWREALKEPETSLIASPDLHSISGARPVAALYGHWLQLAHYSLRLCGGPKLLDALLHVPSEVESGVAGVDYALRSLGPEYSKTVCKDFSSLFGAFERARLAPKPEREEGYVSFVNIDPPVRDTRPVLEPWSAGLYHAAKCPAPDTRVGSDTCLALRER